MHNYAIALFLFLSLPVQAHSGERVDALSAKMSSLGCGIGPVHKVYAKTDWLVYSCEDEPTLIIVAADENPASPFYFMFTVQDNTIGLSGEGNGNKKVTNAVYQELSVLTLQDIKDLFEQTKQQK